MTDLEQALIFVIDGHHYAIDSNEVIQILRVPDITPVPFVHDAIRGICPIEGMILLIMDGHHLLGTGKGRVDEKNDKARIVRIRYSRYNFALLVDEVVSNVNIEKEAFERTESVSDDPITGILKYQDQIVQFLSTDLLVRDVAMPAVQKQDVKEIVRGVERHMHSDDICHKYLFFMVGEERFGLSAEKVREIIFYPESITEIASSTPDVLGLFTIREHVIVAIDMRVIFHMPSPLTERSRIIIVQEADRQIGILVDTILDIKDVTQAEIEALPENYKKNIFEGVVRLDNHLVSVIDPRVIEKMVHETKHFVDEYRQNGSSHTPGETREVCDTDLCEVVVFAIGDEEYAFDIDEVEEIIRITEITPVPNQPEMIRGVINLRGDVVPVAAMHERLGVSENVHEDTKILVCKIGSHKLGFLVDMVSEVMHLSQKNVSHSDNRDELISHVIMLESGKRLILKMDPMKLMEEKEIRDFTMLAISESEGANA